MPEAVDDDAQLTARLKSTLWYHVGKLVDEETINLGVNATPQFMGALTELLWTQIENIAKDLESFANHAGRSKIKTEDVLLLARRNEGLESILKQKIEEVTTENKKKAKEKKPTANGET